MNALWHILLNPHVLVFVFALLYAAGQALLALFRSLGKALGVVTPSAAELAKRRASEDAGRFTPQAAPVALPRPPAAAPPPPLPARPQEPAVRPTPPQTSPAAPPTPPASAPLFSEPNDFVRAVILQEILAAPLSQRKRQM